MAGNDLANWQFEIDEVGPGVYDGRGWDSDGRSVEIRGSTAGDILERLRSWARDIQNDRPAHD